jgi:hypothetical protein
VYDNHCTADCAGATGCESTNPEIQEWIDEQEALKQQAADDMAQKAAEAAQAEADAQQAHEELLEQEKADALAAKFLHSNPEGWKRPDSELHSHDTREQPASYRPRTTLGVTDHLYCEDIIERSTSEDGVLHLGTALNPMSSGEYTCSGIRSDDDGVCCPASCDTCDNSDENCDLSLGGSLCCPSQISGSGRICEAPHAPPCIIQDQHDQSIKVEERYALAFKNATKVCFSAYGFYCEHITNKLEGTDALSLVTAQNPASAAIKIPASAAAPYDDLARVCLHPDVLADEFSHLQGLAIVGKQDDFDDEQITKWREQYNITHPGTGTGYAFENAERFNTLPQYAKFVPDEGCCAVCNNAQHPCGQECLEASEECTKVPGVHDWCACDADTHKKLELRKHFPDNVGKPLDWQGWPYTYPDEYAVGMEDERAATFKGFDSYKYGTVTGDFDDAGRFMPIKNKTYSPSSAKACCRSSCADKYGESSATAMTDCVEGCDLWVASSSLNWESSKWWPKLADKCQKDCYDINKWKTHEVDPTQLDTDGDNSHDVISNKHMTYKSSNFKTSRHFYKYHPEQQPSYHDRSYKSSYFNQLRAPVAEEICAEGCAKFHQCVRIGAGEAEHPENATASVSPGLITDNVFCRKGWGVLQDDDALTPDSPRACCHYSCGKCMTNCNADNVGANGLFESGALDKSSVTARKHQCCIQDILQSDKYCDLHLAPCIVPPESATTSALN